MDILGDSIPLAVVGVVVLAAIFVLISTIKALIVIVPPNSAAIITGRSRQLDEGKHVGYRAVIGGRTLRIPIIEKVSWMPLSTIPIELSVQNAFSKGGIPLSVQAVANVKVASEPETTFNNGVERLLGKPMDEIELLARETLSANLRGVLATLTPEEVNEDRMKFAAELIQEADHDLQKLGLQLDTLKIQNVSDDVGYLAAVGRVKTAQVLKEAQIAEARNQAETMQRQAEAKKEAEISQAMNDAQTKQQQAEARKQAEVAAAQAELSIVDAQNTLRVKRAQLAQQGETAERTAKVEAARAEVEAQQRLEAQRIELQKKKLQADVVEPAEADRLAAEARARADAAPILENGKAQVEVLRLLYAQIANAGDQGFAVFMAEKLPALLGTTVEAVKGIDIDRVVVMDSGSGEGVANAANQKVNAALRTLEGLGSAFGVDIQSVLQGASKRVSANEVASVAAPRDGYAPPDKTKERK
ncbi:MAG TPA: SPFH domain-containing protein [Gemmatimonadaceae bacterium]|nr:SPFH domain-containing protein [Gemmatimonadaceae bacterium]